MHTACLYAALLSPQAPTQPERLAQLDPSDRQWALAIGSIQPLPRMLDWVALNDVPIDLLGYAELGFWINSEFPALWRRLVGDLDEPYRDKVMSLMKHLPSCDEHSSSMCDRVKRCWGLALNRTENQHGIHRR